MFTAAVAGHCTTRGPAGAAHRSGGSSIAASSLAVSRSPNVDCDVDMGQIVMPVADGVLEYGDVESLQERYPDS
jgi:hypothetical protein